MRKIIVFNLITVDGYYAGPNGEIDWHIVDAEFNQFAIDQLNTIDTLLFGRLTYELMASYWPTDSAKKDDPVIANLMNTKTKIVFSKTLKEASWNNTKLMRENIIEEVSKLKEQPGKDLAIFGSGILVQAFTNLGLIDEYRLMVNPIILGAGKPLFENIHEKLNLKLLKTKIFSSGNVLLYYQRAK